jgi:hypothetical protein
MTNRISYLDSRDIRFMDNERELSKKLKELGDSTLLSQTGECMTFGKNVELIKSFFNNMSFDYLQRIKIIGNPSSNGFVNQLTYMKDGYKLFGILKSSKTSTSDNLVYEYYVGSYFINSMIPFFPCFVETFNMYSYPTDTLYTEFQKNIDATSRNSYSYIIDIMKDSSNFDTFEKLEKGSNKRCTFNQQILLKSYIEPTKFCILIQDINKPVTLGDFFRQLNSNPKWGLHLFFILLQIYLPLGKLMDNFTHNDLHNGNILLYELPPNEYVEMEYELEDGSTIKFSTQYIVKIIDYGRCYFKRDNNCSSQVFFDALQNAVQTKLIKNKDKVVQLQNRGYTWFDSLNKSTYYISSYYGNNARDLTTLTKIWLLRTEIKSLLNEKYINDLIESVEKLVGKTIRDPEGGVLNETIVFKPSASINVRTFSNSLISIFESYHIDIENLTDTNFTGKKRGNMKIYMDMKKPMDVSFEVSLGNPIRKTLKEVERIELSVDKNKHYVSPDLSSTNEYEDIFKNVSSLSNKGSKEGSNKGSNKGSKEGSNKGSKKEGKGSNKKKKGGKGKRTKKRKLNKRR